MTRVAFDGRTLSSPAAGVRRYASELLTALAERDDVHLIVVDAAASIVLATNITRARSALSLPTNLGWAALGFPLATWRIGADVVHAPAYTAPLWGTRPLVVTIHDVSYERHPEWYPYRRDWMRRSFYASSARRADRIITDSLFSRDEIVAAYRIDPARIDVVPLAAGAAFTPDPLCRRERFVLHVGDLHPRRNLAMLLDAVIDLRQHDAALSDLRLVLAGADRVGGLIELQQHAADRGHGLALEYVGSPDDAALADWYRRAGVFAYPSRYEGFGLPPLEAMACGAPVIASAAGAVPEVVGDAADVLSPDAAREWRDAIRAVLNDASRAASLGQASLERAKRFSWAHTAEQTVQTYHRAMRTKKT